MPMSNIYFIIYFENQAFCGDDVGVLQGFFPLLSRSKDRSCFDTC